MNSLAMRLILDGGGASLLRSGRLTLNLDSLPKINVARVIDALVRMHQLKVGRTGLDEWAEAVNRLSDDSVMLDKTEKQLAALKRSGIITTAQMRRLMTNYLLESSCKAAASSRSEPESIEQSSSSGPGYN